MSEGQRLGIVVRPQDITHLVRRTAEDKYHDSSVGLRFTDSS